ncbi:MAG TPA: HAMP domain-containing sensor histidine kinase [Kineosporiaceae bacterium]|nr:HAMP domain-containing sensor histidine kinase [Kineosporiaceae bacterium]
MVLRLVDSPPHRILLIEDDAADAGLVARALKRQTEFSYRLQVMASMEEFLADPRPEADVILLDLNLPGYSGLDAFATLTDAVPGQAVVVLTSLDDNEMAMAAVHAGAQDYLVKQNVNPHDLCRAIHYAAERRAATDLLVQLRDDFLAHVSHELRTPLSAAVGAVELLQAGDAGPLPPDQQHLVAMAARNLVQLHAMVADLIDSTMIRSGKPTVHVRTIDVADTVAGVAESMTPIAQRAHVTLTIAVPDHLPAVADPERLVQVLTNLTSNAIRYTPPQGTVTITATQDGSHGEPRVTLTVADTGQGIAPTALPHLFDRLYQVPNDQTHVSRKGLGLGLYLCRELLLAQGGDIGVRSRPGHGSVFTVTLPAPTR